MIEAHRTPKRSLLRPHSSAALAALALASAPSAAAAAPERGSSEVEEEAANVLTLKFALVEAIAPEAEAAEAAAEPVMAAGNEVVTHAGVALSFERALWLGGLAAELNLVFLPEEHGLSLPSELLLKKVFALSPAVEPFVGLGFAAEWLVAGKYEPQYGLASDLGAYFWLERHIGLVAEAEYSLFLSRETEHEIAIAAGGAVRF